MTAESDLDRGTGGGRTRLAASPDTLLSLRAEGGRPPLYCVHPASGSSFCYSGLARLLDRDQPVFAFDAPGLDGDHPPVSSLAELVETHLAAMRPTLSVEHADRTEGADGAEGADHAEGAEGAGRRVSLLGWSMGGTVAFELARRLLASGVGVSALILVDTPVPRWNEPPPEHDILRRFLMEAAGPDRATDEDAAQLRRTLDGNDPGDFDAEFMRSRYAVFRANTHVLVGHRITAPLPLRIDLIRAERSPAEYMRWDRWADAMQTHVVAGDHMSIWDEASLPTLARTVGDILARRDRHVDG